MNCEKPMAVAPYENIRRLDDGFVESFGKGRCHTRGARDPADVALHADPFAAERDPHALGIGENTFPPLAHLFPTEQQIPSGMHALDRVIMRPHVFHLRKVQRFKRGVEAMVRFSNCVLGA